MIEFNHKHLGFDNFTIGICFIKHIIWNPKDKFNIEFAIALGLWEFRIALIR